MSVWPMMCWWLSPLADHSSFLCTGLSSNDGATERACVDREGHSWSDASYAARAIRCGEKDRVDEPSKSELQRGCITGS